MTVQLLRRPFTRTEYERLVNVGVLMEDERVELIEGEIVQMTPIGSRHVACVNRLNTFFNRLVGHCIVVSVQNPIRLLDNSEPQPDIVLLRWREDFYSTELPTASDVLLIVEVAESTVEYDLEIKIPQYAQAGIPEVWLVNLKKGIIEVYLQPESGKYQSTHQVQQGEIIISSHIPDLVLRAETILEKGQIG